MKIITLAMLIASSLASAGTEVATWTDAQGVVHFSDRSPPRQHQRISVREPNIIDPYPVSAAEPAAVATPAPVRQSDPSADFEREEKCHRARTNLKQLRATRRAGYRLSEARKLDALEQRYRADWRFYC